VDVGVHSVLVLLADLDGGVSSQHRVSLHSNLSAAGRVDAVVRTIEEALAESGSPTLIAVGVGAPGVIDHAGRVRVCPPIREWDGIDLSTQLEQRLGCTVRIENDAMAAAEGENRYGAGRGTQNFVYLLAGHRITTASFINGRLHRGYTGAAGMVGEIEALRWERAPARLVDAFAGDGNTVSLPRKTSSAWQSPVNPKPKRQSIAISTTLHSASRRRFSPWTRNWSSWVVASHSPDLTSRPVSDPSWPPTPSS
jgi:hypothetical protein